MRDLIRLAAGTFVVLGLAVFSICAAMALGILLNGGIEGATYPAMMIAFGGAISGASIILVGGGSYLLCSIDQRLEFALKKAGLAAPPSPGSMSADELGAAQVSG